MAKRAFDHCSDEYARFRPPYPDEVLDIADRVAGPPTGRWVADIGAGTGIFSRRLAERGWSVIAVDPSVNMLAHVPADVSKNPPPRIHLACATAEATALAGASVALVACAQSFHWFNPPVALAEFARILLPGGALLLSWNNRDPADGFVNDFETLVGKWNPEYRCEYRRQDWPGKVAATGLFTPLILTSIRACWRLSQEDFVGFTHSVSYIRNVLSSADFPRFQDELRTLLRTRYGNEDCAVPLITEVWTARRVAAAPVDV